MNCENGCYSFFYLNVKVFPPPLANKFLAVKSYMYAQVPKDPWYNSKIAQNFPNRGLFIHYVIADGGGGVCRIY